MQNSLKPLKPYLYINKKNRDKRKIRVFYTFEFEDYRQYAYKTWVGTSPSDVPPTRFPGEGNFQVFTIKIGSILSTSISSNVIPRIGKIDIELPASHNIDGVRIVIDDESGLGGGGGKSTAHYPDAEDE